MQILSEYRALLSEYRALLSEYRALLSAYRCGFVHIQGSVSEYADYVQVRERGNVYSRCWP